MKLQISTTSVFTVETEAYIYFWMKNGPHVLNIARDTPSDLPFVKLKF